MNFYDLSYIFSKSFCLKRKVLPDGKVLSLKKKEYGSAVHFLQIFIKSLSQYLTND